MMANRILPGKVLAESTVLGSAKPVSDEEKAELAVWRSKAFTDALGALLGEAVRDRDFAHELCARVGNFAQGNKTLIPVLKKFMGRSTPGRPTKWSTGAYWQLLHHYAYIRIKETNGDHDETMMEVDEFVRRVYGIVLTPKGIDNMISKAIREMESAGKLDTLPDWVGEEIRKRRARGEKSKRRVPMPTKKDAVA